MIEYQPLVLQKLDIRVPDLHVRQLALHRHLPETTNVRPHAHGFCQCLLYLSGRGEQLIRADTYPVETGTAVFLPPRVRHAFRRQANRRPLCLALDFEWSGTGCSRARVCRLPNATLSEIRQQLARIVHQPDRQEAMPPVRLSALILGVLSTLLSELVFRRSEHTTSRSPVARKLDQLFSTPDAARLPLSQIARLMGYQQDYLNRLLKEHDGLTLGQLRARRLLARSRHLLRETDSVADVAEALGFNDPNYFSRWFRKHTGHSPSRWRTTLDA
jgi:AraC family L-rhamnose operon transcriptional activator RhaR